MICIAIKPGARKTMKGTPNTSPLSLPIAKDNTDRNKRDVISGENKVCIQTIRNLNFFFIKCPSAYPIY